MALLTILYLCTLLVSSANAAASSLLLTLSNSTLPGPLNSCIRTSNSCGAILRQPKRDQVSGTASRTTLPEDIRTLHERRLDIIVGALNTSQVPEISTWLSTLDSGGKWPDVDYTTGCAAQRANWPAQDHWKRLQLIAAAYHGGLAGADQHVENQATRDSITLGMDYWFSRDFVNPACLYHGSSPSCPCSNLDNTLWNSNWFSNVILIPYLVGQTCVLLNETLTPSQFHNCTRITSRSYNSFLDDSLSNYITGANALDLAKIGIDGALLAVNATQIQDAFDRVHSELTIQDATKADGIRTDGSFGQHRGILYNGNYGKDYANDVLDFEVEASGTQFEASSASRKAFETLFDGNRWMIYRNALTGVNHWDFSVLGRFISFAVADGMATASINTNLTEVEVLGELWSSRILTDYAQQLSQNTTNANAGLPPGNRMFFNNDYMVHRGGNYVSTLKMYSSRTKNSECTNSQNPFGFHLSDGALYTYLVGNEYEDIAAAWDWNLVPGTTVDYEATKLDCSHAQFGGIEAFVGGVSDGSTGLAVMRYTNPLTRSLSWQKAWFFLPDDVQLVTISNISSATDAPVLTVLDQRLYDGEFILDDVACDAQTAPSDEPADPRMLWHGGVGYVVDDQRDCVTLSVQAGQKSGSWQAIGTSTQPPTTVDLFTAFLEHHNLDQAVSYRAYPGTTVGQFLEKANQNPPITVRNDDMISAVYDRWSEVAMIAFWHASGGSVTFPAPPCSSSITMDANANLVVIYKIKTGEITVADPSQRLTSVNLTLTLDSEGVPPPTWGDGREKTIVFTLPAGGLAGSSVTRSLQ